MMHKALFAESDDMEMSMWQLLKSCGFWDIVKMLAVLVMFAVLGVYFWCVVDKEKKQVCMYIGGIGPVARHLVYEIQKEGVLDAL